MASLTGMDTTSTPQVTVVVATYNRSAALAFALRSLRAQTFEDWECIVVGDACTDDTETVVASFGDERIRFENLPVNIGDQSGPNNHGCVRARGEFIAFLNHDDLWLREHLMTLITALKPSQGELVFSLLEMVRPAGDRVLYGPPPYLRYDPGQYVPASAWMFRRRLFARVGPWRRGPDCWVASSQDWLYRAWRAKVRMACVPKLTVVALNSGSRPGSYRYDDPEELSQWWHRIEVEPDFADKEAAWLAMRAMDPSHLVGRRLSERLAFAPSTGARLRALVRWTGGRILGFLSLLSRWLGAHPLVPLNLWLYGRKGGIYRYLTRVRWQTVPTTKTIESTKI